MPFLHWKLSELREAAGLTQAEAAKKAGMNKSSYSDLEHGRFASPTVSTLEKVAELFGVDACDLIGNDKPPRKASRSRGRPRRAV